jgi:GNAT superfamily N-acetyltransferase
VNNRGSKTPPLVASERVRIRKWQSGDDVIQRSWPRYKDPCHTLWNIPRSNSMYGGIFSFPYGGGSSSRYVWAIEDRHETLIGRISLRDVEKFSRRARLGISLSAAYTGRGLGTEALILFLEHFFGTLGFNTMVLDVAAFNRRAVRCYEHLGFTCISEEWRRTGNEGCLHMLEEGHNRKLLAYFRREHSGLLVQFLEMQLQRHEWKQHRNTLQVQHYSSDMNDIAAQ